MIFSTNNGRDTGVATHIRDTLEELNRLLALSHEYGLIAELTPDHGLDDDLEIATAPQLRITLSRPLFDSAIVRE